MRSLLGMLESTYRFKETFSGIIHDLISSRSNVPKLNESVIIFTTDKGRIQKQPARFSLTGPDPYGLIRQKHFHLALILIFAAMGMPSTVFILAGFMSTIPHDLEDAARIDGTNDFGIYRRVVMPLTAPSIALVTIYNAVPVWNDFFFPLVFLQKKANSRSFHPTQLIEFFLQKTAPFLP